MQATNTFTDALRGIRLMFSDTKTVICAPSDRIARGIKGIKGIKGRLNSVVVKVVGRAMTRGSGKVQEVSESSTKS